MARPGLQLRDFMSLSVTVIHLLPVLFAQSTQFAFPAFLPDESQRFITLGDVLYSQDHLSFIMNAGTGSGLGWAAKLLYPDIVQMKSEDSGAVASFSTSFTFLITQSEESLSNQSGWPRHFSGFMFTFTGEIQQTILFLGSHSKLFAIEVDTSNNVGHEDPSNNHIGVNMNNLKSSYTYNLCGGEATHCSFPWTGQAYTVWIDYNGSAQSLDVYLANGSLPSGVLKPMPGSSLMTISELDLKPFFKSNMYVGFAGASGLHKESHEILSWSFESTLTELPSSPTADLGYLVIARISVSVIGVTTVIVLLGLSLRTRWDRDSSESPTVDHLTGPRRFTFKELENCTGSFNESGLLGKGGSGSVYRGILTRPAGMVVAVKRLKHESEYVEREFLAELSSVSQIRHRNLVQLIGWCHERGQFLLVFDYMSNGGLDEWLHPNRRRYPDDAKYKRFQILPWEYRFSILSGVAAALEYLHEDWVQCVLHRDIKSSNVMLDGAFTPHLGDFGLARVIDHEKIEKTTMMAGTMGYMAPEIGYTGKATKESDVYSFGVLMLEVVCGKRPINLHVQDPDEDFLLVQSVWRAHEAGSILSAVDQSLLRSKVQSSSPDQVSLLINPERYGGEHARLHLVTNLLHLGLLCSLADPDARPSMRMVNHVISQLLEDPAITVSNLIPHLPSTMPVYGSKSKSMAPSSDGSCNASSLRRRSLYSS